MRLAGLYCDLAGVQASVALEEVDGSPLDATDIQVLDLEGSIAQHKAAARATVAGTRGKNSFRELEEEETPGVSYLFVCDNVTGFKGEEGETEGDDANEEPMSEDGVDLEGEEWLEDFADREWVCVKIPVERW